MVALHNLQSDAVLDLPALTVMVVDDAIHMRRLVGTILDSLGIRQILEAENGHEALALSELQAVDLILSDWNMAPMDGVAFIRRLRRRKDNPNRRTPVIMMTGNTRVDDILVARDTGISEYMAKPISVRQLYLRLEETLLRPRAFVEAADYIGPDRRRSNHPVAVERRRSTSSILKKDDVTYIRLNRRQNTRDEAVF